MHPSVNVLTLAVSLVSLACPSLAGDVHKCRQGERILYQSSPCPPGYERLPIDPPATAPDAAAVAQAQTRAKADIAAAERLRRREAREASERRAREAEAEKHALACARQLEVIRMLESPSPKDPSARRKGQQQATAERKAYIRQCGPLPR